MKDLIRILLVEDEVLIAMRLEMELNMGGYRVCKRVSTGENAIISAEFELPDIILMDIRLGGEIDGIEAVQQIQRIRTCSNTPIIFMTGYPDKEIADRAKLLNPIAYFIKPIKFEDLKSVINSIQY